jgi:hypothetical protein
MRLVVIRYLRFLVTGIVGALFLALTPVAALAEKRVALVIGNTAYRNVSALPNPKKDAAAMAKLFKDAGFDTVVAATDVENLDFKRAIRKFEDAAGDADIAVIFYAGHGIEIGGVNYLIPVDAKLATDRDAQDEAISLDRLVESVDAAKRLRLIIIDACRDNPFVATMKRRTASRSVSSGLGKVEPTGTDTLIAYAAKAGSTAEDGDGADSPFTTALLANLTTPGLDIRLAFGRIRDQVMKITDRRQEPFVYGSLGGGNISLVPAPEIAKEPVTNAKNDYELVAQVGSKKAWEVFLNTYKTGFYADLAREQLAKLGSATPPKVVASLEPPPPPEPVKPTSDESRAWSKLKDASDKDALEKFIARYPNSPLALNAQNRLDVLERAAREREEKARAEREASQRRAEETRQRAEEARGAKETREAALRAEKEQRVTKEAPESEKQKIQDQAARDQLACTRDQARLDNLKAAGNNASVRDDLKRLSQDLTCERLRTQVVASLDKVTSELDKSAAPPPPPANTPELVASAQKQLARLGCYSGDNDGKLDADTKVAIKKYKVQSNQPVTDIAVTDSFVSELSKLKLRVCPAAVVEKPKPAVVEKPKPKDTRKEAKQERSKPSKPESRPQPQARQQASGGGAAHPMIGIGF